MQRAGCCEKVSLGRGGGRVIQESQRWVKRWIQHRRGRWACSSYTRYHVTECFSGNLPEVDIVGGQFGVYLRYHILQHCRGSSPQLSNEKMGLAKALQVGF